MNDDIRKELKIQQVQNETHEKTRLDKPSGQKTDERISKKILQ
jgi:hypothetical protein